MMSTSKAVVQELVLRVNQLDTTELDDELYDLLQYQFLEVFKNLPTIQLLRFKPEMKLLIRFLVWKYSIYNHGCTFGQGMLDLIYQSSSSTAVTKWHRLVLFVMLVLLEWFKERFDLLSLILPTSVASLERLLKWTLSLVKTLSLFNFIVFLVHGKYPSLKERLLGLKLAPTQPQALRSTSYEYMNREILWHGFSEAIFFVMPHFNLFTLRNWWRKIMLLPGNQPMDDVNYSVCAFCERQPTMPHLSDCNHVYCYYCIKGNKIADDAFCCPVCATPVKNYHPLTISSS